MRYTRYLASVEPLEDRTMPALLGQQLLPMDNPWNQSIANAPVAANSAAIMHHILVVYGNGNLHPDFGQDPVSPPDPTHPIYGIPYNVVQGSTTPLVSVVIGEYASESDIVPAPIPANAVLEGDYQGGPAPASARGDSHLIVWDQDTNIDYEFFGTTRPSENADGQWHAAEETVWNLNTDTFRTLGDTSADAAGLPILPGLIRPDEALPVAQGGQGVIDHAIRVTLKDFLILDQFIYPASHVANPGNNNAALEVPMGTRFRLKASVDISKLDPESQIIAQAMKTYGLILADNGENFFISGASYSVDANNDPTLTWDNDDIQDSLVGLKSLTFSDFEIVNLTPIVTGLSVHEGMTGTQVTVIGQNFSGAAGNLQVLFGTTPATSVQFIDDGHLLVNVPAGAGLVNVFVQSGVTIPKDHQDVKSTIFGYGISKAVRADQFTYGPVVTTPAAALTPVVTGNTTSLSVLGNDNAGESKLTYTWIVVARPAGARLPTYSVNATNAAKDTIAKFYAAGNYTFLVIIRDNHGVATTSTVAVSVQQTFTSIRVRPNGVVYTSGSVQFTAAALDQFGYALSVQPPITWTGSGNGTLSSLGLLTGLRIPNGTFIATASAGALQASASILYLSRSRGR